MSKIKNGFAEGSGINIKCKHSKRRAYPLIKPQECLTDIPKIGGEMGYIRLQARKSERESIKSKIKNLNFKIIPSHEDVDEYEIVLKYGRYFTWGPYCHTIKAKKKKNESAGDISTCQVDINVEIGP